MSKQCSSEITKLDTLLQILLSKRSWYNNLFIYSTKFLQYENTQNVK